MADLMGLASGLVVVEVRSLNRSEGPVLANTLSLVRIGRYASSAQADYGTVSAGNSRTSVYDAASVNAWGTLFGGIVGRTTGTSPTFRWSLYHTDGSKNPDTRVGYSAIGTASASYTGPPPGVTIGALVTAAVSVSDNGPSNAGIMIYAGVRYGIDIDVSTATLAHSMLQASAITADNEQFYDRSGVASPPPSAYGSSVASIQGQQTQWIEAWQNVAPVTPATGLAPSGSVTSTAPTFTADFRDLNGAYGASSGTGVDTGDQLNQYHIQVRRTTTTTLLWDQTLTAGPTQKAANAASYGYAGSALSRGVTYEWRIQMSDAFSAMSAWSAWTSFTPANLGFVTLDSTPTGKQTVITGLSLNGRWNHQAATAMTLAQVKLLDSNGTVLQTGAQAAPTGAPIASSALPGTLFTATWAQTTFTSLAWGRSYQYQIRGYDGTNWSDYSAARSFTTDAAPAIPSSLSPSGGTVYTSFPLLRCSFTDADDTYLGALTGVFRITRPDATTVDVTPTYNTAAVSAPWQFQTTVTQLSAFGTYSWKAVGFDGTLYSGEQTTLAAAIFSSSATFQYQSGPVIAVSSPAANATVTSASIPVTWSVTSGGPQAKYQLYAYLSGTTTLAYDSGLITSVATTATIPSGYLHGVTPTAYDLIVAITSTVPLTGSSNIVPITVSFTAPAAPTNVQSNPAKIGNDPTATAIATTWDQTTYSTSDATNTFQAYNVYRSAAGGPDATQILFARLTSPTETTFVDVTPASGFAYTYGVTTETLTGTDTLESAPSAGTATVTLTSNVFTLVGNGQTYRANLVNVTARDHDRAVVEAVYVAVGAANVVQPIRPVTIRSKARYWTATFSGFLITDAYSTAQQKHDELIALDAQDGVTCWCDGRGKKRFIKISNLKISDLLPDYYSFSFNGREEKYSQGV
jgi:hypothetical protein